MHRDCLTTYYYDGLTIDVYGCCDDETDENSYEFYDLFDDDVCLNEGHLFEEIPSWEEVREFLETNGGDKYAKMVMQIRGS